MAQVTNQPTPENGQTCVIAEGTRIEGKFVCSENVRLDGQIKGEVNVAKKLVMGINSQIEGNVQSQSTAVQGKVKGNVNAAETLQLLPTANVEGDIKANAFIVDEGAVYNGALNIGKKN
jgi:cytoskeletal protein CcmA (bactofilin family)